MFGLKFLLPFPGSPSTPHDLGKSQRTPERTLVSGPAGRRHLFRSGQWACDRLGGTCGAQTSASPAACPPGPDLRRAAWPRRHPEGTLGLPGVLPHGVCEGVVITAVLRRDAHSPSLWQLGNKKKAQVLSIRPPPWGSLILGSADRAVRAHHPSSPSESHTLACWGPACRIPRREKTAFSDPCLWVFTPWRSPPPAWIRAGM